jgi:thiol:disulfide interchange protein DsbD
MKKILLFSLIVVTALAGKAQLNPITWSFTAKKIADKTYEIQMKATIQNKWHLYSQKQPEDAIVDPTTFKFSANPLLILDGKVLETGKLEKFTDKALGISANQYSNSVVFTQKIKLKVKAKTKLTGTVEYQTCDDEKCLPPKTINIVVTIE